MAAKAVERSKGYELFVDRLLTAGWRSLNAGRMGNTETEVWSKNGRLMLIQIYASGAGFEVFYASQEQQLDALLAEAEEYASSAE